MRMKTVVCMFIKVEVKVLVAQLCLTLCDPMDCSPPGSSAHGILQARVLEWVAILFSRGPSQPWSPALQVDSLPSAPLEFLNGRDDYATFPTDCPLYFTGPGAACPLNVSP